MRFLSTSGIPVVCWCHSSVTKLVVSILYNFMSELAFHYFSAANILPVIWSKFCLSGTHSLPIQRLPWSLLCDTGAEFYIWFTFVFRIHNWRNSFRSTMCISIPIQWKYILWMCHNWSSSEMVLYNWNLLWAMGQLYWWVKKNCWYY